MNRTPRFTIAIPTYNNERTVSEAVRSALSQDYSSEFDVLVVNNASTDDTLRQVQKFLPNPRLTIVTNPETCSLYENHNVCLKEAKGDYVLFCHSDDALDITALSTLHRSLEHRGFPRRIVMWGHSLHMDFHDELKDAGFRTGQLFAGIVATRPFLHNGLTPSGTCYCKSLIQHGGFLPATFKAAPSDASSMVLAALNGFRFEMIEDILFFRHGASTAVQGRPFEDIVAAHQDAFSLLFSQLDRGISAKLLSQNARRNPPSLLFYNSISETFPKEALLETLKWVLRRPLSLRNRKTRSILFRILARNLGRARVGR